MSSHVYFLICAYLFVAVLLLLRAKPIFYCYSEQKAHGNTIGVLNSIHL